jgi:hypothetical protein
MEDEIVLGCKIPHELDALKCKAIGKRRREGMENRSVSMFPFSELL